MPCSHIGDEAADQWTLELGLFRSLEEWIAEALELQHPFDGSGLVKVDLVQTIEHIVSLGGDRIACQRRRFLDFYRGMVEKGTSDEIRLPTDSW